MQLEELKQQWQRLDQKLDKMSVLGTELARQIILQPAQRRLNRFAVWPVIDILFCACVMLFFESFLSGHWHDWKLVMPAAVVMLSALALLACCILQLQHVSQLDWSSPVADIQTALERLRIIKVQQFKWIILLSPLAGFCALMVGLHWLFEWLTVDRVKILDQLHPWIVANYLFGILFVPLGYLAARALASRFQGHPRWQSVLDGISGTTLKAARHDVQRWANLHQDASEA